MNDLCLVDSHPVIRRNPQWILQRGKEDNQCTRKCDSEQTKSYCPRGSDIPNSKVSAVRSRISRSHLRAPAQLLAVRLPVLHPRMGNPRYYWSETGRAGVGACCILQENHHKFFTAQSKWSDNKQGGVPVLRQQCSDREGLG